MKTVVCYKLVPDDSNISVKPDNSLDFSNCEWEIGQYDLRAVETAAQITEKDPANVLIALTVGDGIVENSKLKKSILSRGPQEMLAVKSDKLRNADSAAVAEILAETIKGIGDVDLVFFGEGSGDSYAQQVGNITGALLGWNTVNAVSKVEVVDDGLVVERNLENCVEVVKVALPAAISVTSDICMPRLASMKEILKAGKKPSTIKALEELTSDGERKVTEVSLKAQVKAARNCEILSGDDAVDKLIAYFKKLG